MKKLMLFTLVFAITTSFCFAKDKIIAPKDLSNDVQIFLQEHFPDTAVKFAEEEKGEYEIRLEDGTEIEIKKNATWGTIESRNPLPTTLLPDAAVEYISAEYPNDYIVEIEKNRRNYEVKLSSGWELLFKTDGSFIKITDFDD